MGIECRRTRSRVVLVVLFVLVTLSATPPVITAEAPEVEITWGVEIPVRDGVRLNATVYKPLEMEGPSPRSFLRT